MVRRGPKRSVLCAQSEELHQKRACLESDARYGVGKFERGGGGSYFWKGGFANPPNPPGYGPAQMLPSANMKCSAARPSWPQALPSLADYKASLT